MEAQIIIPESNHMIAQQQALIGQTNLFGEALARRAMQEAQASVIVAKQYPRDIMQCYTKAMKEVERPSLARVAFYAFPRGGQTVSGPSIRLLEVVARHFGNLDYGWAELQRMEGQSLCEAWCRDLEANNGHPLRFVVMHTRDKKGRTPEKLTDERDIYEKVANYCVRRMRSCMETHIPRDIIDDLVEKAKRVIAAGDGKQPWEVRLRNMLLAFDGLGVTKEMIEKRLKHPYDQVNQDEFAELYGIFNSLKDKQASREDFFPDFISEDATTVKDVNAKGAAETADLKRKDLIERIDKLIETKRNAGMDEMAIQERIKMSTDAIKGLKLPQLQAVFEILSK